MPGLRLAWLRFSSARGPELGTASHRQGPDLDFQSSVDGGGSSGLIYTPPPTIFTVVLGPAPLHRWRHGGGEAETWPQRTYLQVTYLLMELYLDYMEDSYNSIRTQV